MKKAVPENSPQMQAFYKELLAMQDVEYKNFQAQMLPSVDEDALIGIRTADLVKFSKKFFDEKFAEEFMAQLPHKYFEENLIHVWLISNMKNYEKCLDAAKKFLPYIDNWAVCDSLIPKIFAQNTEKLLPEVKNWLASDSTYAIRFGILTLMKFYLDRNFDKKYLKMVAELQTEEYYVEMMVAWFFTEALIKHYDAAVVFLRDKLLMPKIHTKTIKKAVESTRLTKAQKEYLKSLRWRSMNA